MNELNTSKLPKICIISFSEIARDGRVLRQITCLQNHAVLKVIGFGGPPVFLQEAIDSGSISWVNLSRSPYKWLKNSNKKIANAEKYGRFL